MHLTYCSQGRGTVDLLFCSMHGAKVSPACLCETFFVYLCVCVQECLSPSESVSL